MLVVDVMRPVIEWHQKGLVPLGETLTGDPRCRLIEGDFFALAGAPEIGFDPEQPGRKFHAVLLDIDHSPQNLLDEKNATFYSADGLRRLAAQLLPGGVFALWSDDPPDEIFLKHLAEVFESPQAHVVKFPNPLLERDSASTVYVAIHPAVQLSDPILPARSAVVTISPWTSRNSPKWIPICWSVC